MGINRRFKRFLVAHSDFLGGNITESDYQLRLSTIGLGGCGFVGSTSAPDLVPPKEIICSFFTKHGLQFEDSKIIQGNLVYVSPSNVAPFMNFYYGVKFFEEERERIAPLIQELEALEKKGLVQAS